jgi:hypothetical protein
VHLFLLLCAVLGERDSIPLRGGASPLPLRCDGACRLLLLSTNSCGFFRWMAAEYFHIFKALRFDLPMCLARNTLTWSLWHSSLQLPYKASLCTIFSIVNSVHVMDAGRVHHTFPDSNSIADSHFVLLLRYSNSPWNFATWIHDVARRQHHTKPGGCLLNPFLSIEGSNPRFGHHRPDPFVVLNWRETMLNQPPHRQASTPKCILLQREKYNAWRWSNKHHNDLISVKGGMKIQDSLKRPDYEQNASTSLCIKRSEQPRRQVISKGIMS